MISTLFAILGSLGMFLFGMRVMSDALQKISGDKLRSMMRTMTSNRFAGLVTGLSVTCLVQSSSATTVMIVGFVNAGLLNLTESIGMIMGANLGTTTTFWIVSILGFKFSMSKIALPIVGIGLPLIFFKKQKIRDTGEFFIGFGLLFLGLMFLKDSVPDISANPDALAFITKFTGHGILSVLVFFLFGTILTVVVQSSSVAGAITITMAAKGWIDFPTAAAIILGENIGTTITANLAALSGNLIAKRAAFAHFLFNVAGVCWAIPLFAVFAKLIDWIVPGDALAPEHIPTHMAAFHTMFNLMNIALLIGFVPQLARLVERVMKGRKGSTAKKVDHLEYDPGILPRTGELDLAEAEEDVRNLGNTTKLMLNGFVDLFEKPGADLSDRLEAMKSLEKKTDQQALAVTNYLVNCAAHGLGQESRAKVSSLLTVVAELEDIADCAYRLAGLAERKHRKGRNLPENTVEEVRQFSDLVLRFMEFYNGALNRDVTVADMESAYQLENQIDSFRKTLRKESQRRMATDGESIKAEMLYIDILNNMESIGNRSLNIMQALRHKD